MISPTFHGRSILQSFQYNWLFNDLVYEGFCTALYTMTRLFFYQFILVYAAEGYDTKDSGCVYRMTQFDVLGHSRLDSIHRCHSRSGYLEFSSVGLSGAVSAWLFGFLFLGKF